MTVTLMTNTMTELNAVGLKFKADGYTGGDGLHTVGIYISEFVGRIMIQGTLALDPEESDWFNITLDDQDLNYIEYMGSSDSATHKFTGNFVWVRAKMDRTFISPEPDPNAVGRVLKILMNN